MPTSIVSPVRVGVILALSWILTFSTIATAACRIKAQDRALRTEFGMAEQQLKTKIMKLENRLIELSTRNESNRRILALAGYLPKEQATPEFVTEAP